MKQATTIMVAMVCMLGVVGAYAGTVSEPSIEGKYMEVRSCDVFTAACFANSEVGLEGEEAILAWDVTRGSYQGVDLGGLKVVAVVRASSTLGDTDGSIFPARSVLFVDEKANAAQRVALRDFASEMAGQLLEDILRVEETPIEMNVQSTTAGFATLTAGDAVSIETRAMTHHDMHCGNDEAYYAPLTDVENAQVAFTEHDMFNRHDLGVTWNSSGRRSAWLGTFAR